MLQKVFDFVQERIGEFVQEKLLLIIIFLLSMQLVMQTLTATAIMGMAGAVGSAAHSAQVAAQAVQAAHQTAMDELAAYKREKAEMLERERRFFRPGGPTVH